MPIPIYRWYFLYIDPPLLVRALPDWTRRWRASITRLLVCRRTTTRYAAFMFAFTAQASTAVGWIASCVYSHHGDQSWLSRVMSAHKASALCHLYTTASNIVARLSPKVRIFAAVGQLLYHERREGAISVAFVRPSVRERERDNLFQMQPQRLKWYNAIQN